VEIEKTVSSPLVPSIVKDEGRPLALAVVVVKGDTKRRKSDVADHLSVVASEKNPRDQRQKKARVSGLEIAQPLLQPGISAIAAP
jgi:hypothetical protein